MSHSYTSLNYHLIFRIKRGHPVMSKELRQRLFPYIGGIFRNINCKALAINGVEDHLHVLSSQRADIAVSDVMRTVKSNSSKWIHETFPEYKHFAWQTGYAAFTVSKSGLERVRAYILRQEEHHRRLSFKDELREYCKKHGIAYEDEDL